MKALVNIRNQYINLTKDDIFDFKKFNSFAIVHHSNSIEGSTLTKEETFMLLNERLTPKNKPLEHTFMAIDHLEALEFVLELAKNKKLLTPKIIREISAKVMQHTGSEISAMAGNFNSAKGDYRKLTVRAGSSTFMDYKKVPVRVEELTNYINKQICKINSTEAIYNLSFDVHFQLVSIHPFADGNGRVSRLLMNYVQAYHNEPLSVVFKEDKQKYYQVLVETRDKEDIRIFRKFMVTQAKKFFEQQINELTKTQKPTKNSNNGLSFLF